MAVIGRNNMEPDSMIDFMLENEQKLERGQQYATSLSTNDEDERARQRYYKL